jgi:hypothetical protein
MVKLPWYTEVTAETAAEIVRKTRAPATHTTNSEQLAKDLNSAFYTHMGATSIDIRSRAYSVKNLKLAKHI